MRALVTGASGFIGHHLVSGLRQAGWDVVCLDIKPLKTNDSSIQYVYVDITKPQTCASSAEKAGRVDALFHLAALLPSHGPFSSIEYLTGNCAATIALLEWARRTGVKSCVCASTLTVIGFHPQPPITETHDLCPEHPYQYSKLCAELFCELQRRNENMNITCLRISSPYGPGMDSATVLPLFVRLALAGKDILYYGSGRRTQNFVHVSDVSRAFILAAESNHPGVYNLGGPETVSMRDLANLVIDLTPETSSLARPAGVPDPQENCRWEVDLTHAMEGLGYSPKVSLKEGLSSYIGLVS